MYQDNRAFVKSQMSDVDLLATADIAKGIPQPVFESEYLRDANIVYLPKITDDNAPKMTLCHIEENGDIKKLRIG